MARKRIAVSFCIGGLFILSARAFLTFWQNDEARFIKAVQDGDINTVRAMLNKNSELIRSESPVKGGTTPVLHIAIGIDHKEIVRLFLSHGLNLNNYPHALWLARSREMADLLIQNGSDVNRHGRNGETVLHMYASTDNIPMAEFVIRNGADVNAKDQHGQTPLHHSAKEGRLNSAKVLVAKGADISARNKNGQMPFDYAIIPVWEGGGLRCSPKRIHGCKEVAEYLLSCGAASTFLGAVWLGRMDLVRKYVESDPSLVNAVYDEVWLGQLRPARTDVVSNPSLVDGMHYKEPVLFAAILGRSTDILEYLLSQGAEINVKGRYGQTPLQMAAYMGYTDVMRILLNHGVDVNEPGGWGESALHWAAVRGYIEAVKILLDQDADTNAQTTHHAYDLSSLEIKEGDLIERELRRFRQRQEQDMARALGTSVQVHRILRLAFAKGDTPLHAAACWNHIDIAKLLINNSAEVNRTNNLGQTPLHYSVAFRHNDITQILLNSGADPHIKTSDGMTAAAIARKVGDRRLRRLVAE